MGSNNTKSLQALVTENEINSDPRSPTPDITRTPLHNNGRGKSTITKNVDLSKTFENMHEDDEKPIFNNPILSAVLKNHLQSYDPRSPTQEFERTPIIVADKIKKLCNEKRLLRLEKEDSCGSPSLLCEQDNNGTDKSNTCTIDGDVKKNLCNDFCDITLNDSLKEEPLGSSTASNDCIAEDISNIEKPKKFMETNFDYEEAGPDSFDDSEENVCIKNIPLFKILDNDPRSPSVGIERTPIIVEKLVETRFDENVDVSERKLIQTLRNTNVELRQVIKSNGKGLEGLLIYEDKTDDVNVTPKKPKTVDENESRTPLSCMKNKTEELARSKSIKNSKNSYVPAKDPKRVSHIPRLKSLSKHIRLNTDSTVSMKNISKCSIKTIGGDCENTPPHTHRDIWDKDNSIVL